MSKTTRGAFLVVASSFCYSTMAILAKITYANGANVPTTLAIRFSLACLVVWAIIFAAGYPVKINFNELKRIVLMSILGYTFSSTLFFLSLELLTASLASIILFTYPVMVALAECLFCRLKPSAIKSTALVLATVGLVMVLGTAIKNINIIGVVFGLGAAAAYSAYLILGNKAAKERPPAVTIGYMLLFAAAGFDLYALSTGTLNFMITPSGWWSIIGLAVFSTALPIVFLFTGMQWIETSRAAIISTFEPVFTVAIASVILSESLRLAQVVGGLVILAAIIILQTEKSKETLILKENN
ncbi:DMT family transporter [Pelotomaculum propionicicum]|uniref:DMT family transporter n=1 Tax=Pelotomaculum propionicicum TaxID=258475 RepID=UPI003B808830